MGDRNYYKPKTAEEARETINEIVESLARQQDINPSDNARSVRYVDVSIIRTLIYNYNMIVSDLDARLRKVEGE